MRNRAMLAFTVFTIFNVSILFVNLAYQANASVSHLSWRELSRDKDFRRAVQKIVSDCAVTDGSVIC